MPRARRKPKDFQTTDTGPDTPAQREGAIYERPRGGRPGERRKRKEHPLDTLLRCQSISLDQANRGRRALDLFEKMLCGGGGLSEYVNRTPDWAAIIAHAVEGGFAFGRAVSGIPRGPISRVFKQVVLEGYPVSRLPGCKTDNAMRRLQIARLRVALDAIDV